ncbi:hypothetical protein [Gimesia fumaroli]|uniref:Uncharacterized protein n=1 Tax=Gimesia fumaroli TaxID=2527976 RepID=A0A518I5U1_9PLAN|nr:hypothetical protein [Gimesia fumaroli]QDV48470.1 hypothetical protein Enr17x_04820 [Gimesia fumaroli]
MQQFFHYWSVGAAGAAAFEMLKAYELRGKIEHKRYQALIKSVWFWLAFAGMVVASGFFAWAFYSDSPSPPTNWQLVVVGIAARSIGRSAIEAIVANQKQHLGEGEDDVSIKDAFR